MLAVCHAYHPSLLKMCWGVLGAGDDSDRGGKRGCGTLQETAWRLGSCKGEPAEAPTPLLDGLVHPPVEQVGVWVEQR